MKKFWNVLRRRTESRFLVTAMTNIVRVRRKRLGKPAAARGRRFFFLTGGTQTNQIVISSMLKSYEGVVAAQTGHVSVHEAGAIEHSGHKVLTIPGHEGKIKAEELAVYLKAYWEDSNHEHMVFPGMVYLSHPTEYGTLYTEAELADIAGVCGEYSIPLYLDGARLGYGLMSRGTDVTLAKIARYCDVFYIGGTKVGAFCGEAVVFPKKNMPAHFLTLVKQKGGLLAKGRLLGVQFDTLFTDDLYFRISAHAINMAEKIKEIFREKEKRFFIDSPTNQQFLILEDGEMACLKEQVNFDIWERYDEGHTVGRFATSWATEMEDVEKLREIMPSGGR